MLSCTGVSAFTCMHMSINKSWCTTSHRHSAHRFIPQTLRWSCIPTKGRLRSRSRSICVRRRWGWHTWEESGGLDGRSSWRLFTPSPSTHPINHVWILSVSVRSQWDTVVEFVVTKSFPLPGDRLCPVVCSSYSTGCFILKEPYSFLLSWCVWGGACDI